MYYSRFDVWPKGCAIDVRWIPFPYGTRCQQYLENNGVVVYELPVHTSGKTQPCDVKLFEKLKTKLRNIISDIGDLLVIDSFNTEISSKWLRDRTMNIYQTNYSSNISLQWFQFVSTIVGPSTRKCNSYPQPHIYGWTRRIVNINEIFRTSTHAW